MYSQSENDKHRHASILLRSRQRLCSVQCAVPACFWARRPRSRRRRGADPTTRLGHLWTFWRGSENRKRGGSGLCSLYFNLSS